MRNELLRQIDSYQVYFEDLDAGDNFVSAGRTVTEADVVNFAGLSGDYNSLHVDAEFASQTANGQRIAHGLLVLAIASGLCTRLPVMKFLERSILGLAGLECRWMKPTLLGDTLHVAMSVESKEASRKPDRGTLLIKRTVYNQREEAVMESNWRLVVRTRPPETPA